MQYGKSQEAIDRLTAEQRRVTQKAGILGHREVRTAPLCNPRGSEVVMLQPRGRARGTIAGTYRFHSGGEERFCDQWLAVSKISSSNAESNRGRISL
jgi:hypothetical protein